METVRTVGALRKAVRGWQGAGDRTGAAVALVPTMGALHDAHLSLVALGRAKAERVVATIFVNPTQFGAGEDFDSYPRDEARDAALLREAGCDLLFAPPPSEMYPPGFATEVRVRGLTDVLCGAARPGHFDGVAQVVTKLLNQAGADRAIFGEKDWQQLAIIRRLARDLDIPTEILGAPILREPDGLALSSRNRYLSETERSIAPALFSVLSAVGSRFRRGHSAEDAVRGAEDELVSAGFERVDYVEIRDGVTLAPIDGDAAGHPAARVFGAAHLGRARLIDNIAVAGADAGSGVRAMAEGAR